MNFYNPYFYQVPTNFVTPRVGLFSRLFGGSGITLSGILNGTQRALNFANQAIPLVKQVKPMIGNAKTMFKVMNEFKKTEKPSKSTRVSKVDKEDKNINEKTSELKEENKKFPVWAIGVICGASIAGMGATVFVIWFVKHKKRKK